MLKRFMRCKFIKSLPLNHFVGYPRSRNVSPMPTALLTKAAFARKQRAREPGVTAVEIDRRYAQSVVSHRGTPAAIRGRGNYNQVLNSRARPAAVRGRGDFRQVAREIIPDGTFARAGGAIGGAFGGPVGRTLGRMGGGFVSHLVGFGDYTVRQNSVMQRSMAGVSGKDSSFDPTGSARIRLRRRECVGVINAPADPASFNSTTLRIQATNSTLMPWGGGIALLFQEYQFHGGVFSFESTFSNYSAAGPLGTVVMSTQYNAADRPFQDVDAMLNSAFRTSGNPSENLNHGLECDPNLQDAKFLKCRNHANDWSSQAPNNYDFGNFTIATVGLPAACANAQIGRLYFTYDLELLLPRVADPLIPSRFREISQFLVGQAGVIGTAEFTPASSGGVVQPATTVLPKNLYYTIAGSYAATPTTVAKSGAQFIGNMWGGCTAYDGQQCSLTACYNNQLALGNPPNPNEIVMFPPDITGENQTWYEPATLPTSAQGQFVWVCGTPYCQDPDEGTAVTFNFRHGGWYELTFLCPQAMIGCFARAYCPTSPTATNIGLWNSVLNDWQGSSVPFFQGDEIPAYTTEGADMEYTQVLSNAPAECFTPKAGTTPPLFYKKFGDTGCPLEIKWKLRFNSSAPTRSIRFAGVRAPVTAAGSTDPQVDLYYYGSPRSSTPTTSGVTWPGGTVAPQWSVRFLGEDIATQD